MHINNELQVHGVTIWKPAV